MVARVRLIPWGGVVDPSRVLGSRRVWERRDGFLLLLEDASGATGAGEATPLPGLSKETVEDAGRALAQIDWSRLDPKRVLDGGPVGGHASQLPPSARFALETACADLTGALMRTPTAQLLAPFGRAQPMVIVNTLLGHVRSADLVERAREALRRGAAAVKVKLAGRDIDAELKALRQVRDEIGPSVRLRTDLGGALAAPEAARWLAGMANVGVEAVEEPCPAAELPSLPRGPVPWLADESLASGPFREEILRSRGCAGVVLKPTLLGGLRTCLELARRARETDKSVTITHAFEGPVGLAACGALALAGGADLAGLDEHGALSAFAPWKSAMFSAEPPLAVRATPHAGLALFATSHRAESLDGTDLWRR